MSAITFKDLSTELTQAIESQLDTPSGTQARCTLGREKVMVLVEYPTENGQTEPLADSTLDWLEQSLRQQFDTVGLPEEAADLSGTGEAVAVQLFLKHHSEPQPFTARSFTWKVADGFDDLFGAPTGDREALAEAATPVFQDATGSLSAPEAETEATTVSPEQTAWALEPETPTHSENELEDDFLSMSAIENLDSEVFSLPGEISAINAESSELDLPTVDLPITRSENSDLSDEGFFDLESSGISRPSAATDSELAADFENALDSSAARLAGDETDAEIEFVEDMFSELLAAEDLTSEELSSDFLASNQITAEPPQRPEAGAEPIPPSEADGPTSQANALESSSPQSTGNATVSLIDPFDGSRLSGLSHDEDSSAGSSVRDEVSNEQRSRDESDDSSTEDRMPDLSNLDEDEAEPGEEIFEANIGEIDLEENNFELSEDEAEPGEEIFALSEEETAVEVQSDVGFDAYGSDEYNADAESADELNADDFAASEYATNEYETTEEDETSEAERYQLEQTSQEDAPYESVALIDEREVQKQREQWQQQTKGNPWFFAGAIGFFAIGLLGFVLTRPCSFGACPRIETAQAQGERALSDLTLGANLEAVTTAKQQLNRSVRSLQPIPFWSSHYSEAQAVLPKFESQLTALDRVSAAQASAYQAALASQNPPHSSTKWESIAEQWRGAIAILENVPADNQVRRLADRKLVEYRANLSTIKVRIDAEAQAEASLLAAQSAATLATATAKQASSLENWESALENWQSAVVQIDQIPQGTLAYEEAQGLQAEYREQMEIVRDRTLQERNADRTLSKAQQLAREADRVAREDQWTVAVQTWSAAVNQIQDIAPGTAAHTEAQPLVSFYQQSLAKADSNRQVSQRFQPVEPSFYAACGATTAQRCTYSVRGGNVRLNLSENYDRAINQSITPPDQRSEVSIDSGVVTQSNQLLKEIALLSTQGNFPIELYDAKGGFLARYRPDLNGFVKDREETILTSAPPAASPD